MIALIPIPPMPSPRPRVTQRGTYMPTAYRRHVDALALALRTQCRTHHPSGVPLWVEIEVRLQRPKSAPKAREYPCVRPDVDNYIKTVLDAATHAGLWADDGQVVSLRAIKVYGNPGYLIRVEAMTPPVGPDAYIFPADLALIETRHMRRLYNIELAACRDRVARGRYE